MREEIRTALQTAIKAGWTGDVPALAWENNARTENKQAWARFFIVFGENGAAAIGKDFNRMIGYFGVQVFIPENGGMAPATKATDKIEAIFQYQRYQLDANGSELQIESADGPAYKGTVDGWAQYHATCEWRAEIVNQAQA